MKAADEPLKHIGLYSNTITHKNEDPSTSGCEIDIYSSGDRYFGTFSWADWQLEMPTGILYDVVIDKASNSISLSAKLSTGSTYSAESGKFRQAHDLFEFHGHFGKGVLSGFVTQKDGYTYPPTLQMKKFIKLNKLREKTAVPYKSYDEWASWSIHAPANW